jgi:hypothetical protein
MSGPSPPPPPASPPPEPEHAPFLQVVGAVLWSFLGIRKRNAMASDVAKIRPQHVIVVGLVLAAIFVLSLVALVQFITRAT